MLRGCTSIKCVYFNNFVTKHEDANSTTAIIFDCKRPNKSYYKLGKKLNEFHVQLIVFASAFLGRASNSLVRAQRGDHRGGREAAICIFFC